MSKVNDTLLHLRFCQFPQFWRHINTVQVTHDDQKRNWDMSYQAHSDFEHFLLTMIPKQIPKVFLEGYDSLIEQSQKLPWPKSPRLIFTSNILWHYSVSMAYTSTKVEQGSTLVYAQHGGVYGVAKFTFAEEHEIKISDRYLTWGWSIKSNPSIIPIGILKVDKKDLQNYNNNKNLVLITQNSPRYTYRLSSESSLNFKSYIENYFLFSTLLNEDIKDNLVIRLHTNDNGWEQHLRWRDRFPGVKLDHGNRKIYDLLRESRIVVLTYNSTGILETLSLGIPTVIFFDQ